jgi:hypothetical protein
MELQEILSREIYKFLRKSPHLDNYQVMILCSVEDFRKLIEFYAASLRGVPDAVILEVEQTRTAQFEGVYIREQNYLKPGCFLIGEAINMVKLGSFDSK